MSTFDNENFRWRETFLVFFKADHHPQATLVEEAIASLNGAFEIKDVRANESGGFESATIIAPNANAAIDISLADPEAMAEQMEELVEELKPMVEGPEEQEKFEKLLQMDARFDLLHFEQVEFFGEDEEEEEILDPGALLLVMEKLAELCHGVSVDPQSNSLM